MKFKNLIFLKKIENGNAPLHIKKTFSSPRLPPKVVTVLKTVASKT